MSRKKIRIVEKRKDKLVRLRNLVKKMEELRSSLEAVYEKPSEPILVVRGPSIQFLQELEYSRVSEISISDTISQIGGFDENNESAEGGEAYSSGN